MAPSRGSNSEKRASKKGGSSASGSLNGKDLNESTLVKLFFGATYPPGKQTAPKERKEVSPNRADNQIEEQSSNVPPKTKKVRSRSRGGSHGGAADLASDGQAKVPDSLLKALHRPTPSADSLDTHGGTRASRRSGYSDGAIPPKQQSDEIGRSKHSSSAAHPPRSAIGRYVETEPAPSFAEAEVPKKRSRSKKSKTSGPSPADSGASSHSGARRKGGGRVTPPLPAANIEDISQKPVSVPTSAAVDAHRDVGPESSGLPLPASSLLLERFLSDATLQDVAMPTERAEDSFAIESTNGNGTRGGGTEAARQVSDSETSDSSADSQTRTSRLQPGPALSASSSHSSVGSEQVVKPTGQDKVASPASSTSSTGNQSQPQKGASPGAGPVPEPEPLLATADQQASTNPSSAAPITPAMPDFLCPHSPNSVASIDLTTPAPPFDRSETKASEYSVASMPPTPVSDPIKKASSPVGGFPEDSAAAKAAAPVQEKPSESKSGSGAALLAAPMLIPSPVPPPTAMEFTGTRADIRPVEREGALGREDYVAVSISEGGLLSGVHPSAQPGESEPLKDPEDLAATSEGSDSDDEERGGWGRGLSFHAAANWGRSLTDRSRKTFHRAKKQVDSWQVPLVPPKRSNCCCLSFVVLVLLLLGIGGAAAGLFVAGVFQSKAAAPAPPGPASADDKRVVAFQPAGVPHADGVPSANICSGACCSASQPVLYVGEAVMPSLWWSNKLDDNAQVQFFAVANRTWVGPYSQAAWNKSSPVTLSATLAEAPGPLEVFTVRRTSGNLLQFLAPNGLYVEVQSDGSLEAVAVEPSSLTTFRAVAVNTYEVYLRTPEGKYVTVVYNASRRLQVASVARPGRGQLFAVREAMGLPAIRGVNMGGWLLTEEWMTPKLFAEVPSLMDGVQIQLQSVNTGKWLVASETGDKELSCTSSAAAIKETFNLRRSASPQQLTFQLRSHDKNYWQLNGSRVYASADRADPRQRSNFTFVFSPLDNSTLMIQASSGRFLRVRGDGSLTADVTVSAAALADGNSGTWRSATAFQTSVVSRVRGEWQLASALGGATAAALATHWASFITEADFQWLQTNGVNSVRIPVGFWITQGGTPDAPFVAGSLPYLDSAMALGEKYSVRVFLSMHGAEGSQNGYEHSASRDGIPEFTEANTPYINNTLAAINFLSQRYAKYTSFFGIGLLNEPISYGVYQLSTLKEFYLESYRIMRQHSKCAYVGISARIDQDFEELDGFMTGINATNIILDLHEYHTFDPLTFGGKDFDFNLQYVKTTRVQRLKEAQQGNRLVMVGEWSLALREEADATSEEYAEFGQAQLRTYGQTSAGWFFWNYKLGRDDYPNWSFQQSVSNGWLKKSAGFW